MKNDAGVPSAAASFIEEAATQLDRASAAKKCWPCGCFADSLNAIESGLPRPARSARLTSAIEAGRATLIDRKYDCLGCEDCYPALAINALNESGAALEIDPCLTEASEPRQGWPALPGDYAVLRYRAPVAVCTLHDVELVEPLADSGEAGVSIVGTLATENLGIERLITNVVANPNIRFLVLCGTDSRQDVGHLPGQSMVALSRSGVDEEGHIIGAGGKRPVLKNINRKAIEHFRSTIEILDLVEVDEEEEILRQIRACAARDPGPAELFHEFHAVRPSAGHLPNRMVLDPSGYFVIYVAIADKNILIEHYSNDGVINSVIEGRTATELYTAAIEKNLLSRMDHAAYLGRELARAEAALRLGEPYVQEGAPEQSATYQSSPACGCPSECEGESG